MDSIACRTAIVASLSDFPGARLNEIVLATNDPWWFTASAVLPGPNEVNDASGIIVSFAVLTAAPDEALPLPVFASELVAALRAELAAMVEAVVVVDLVVTVPTTAFVVSVPLALPPEVLT
jgi:hypothetical protein